MVIIYYSALIFATASADNQGTTQNFPAAPTPVPLLLFPIPMAQMILWSTYSQVLLLGHFQKADKEIRHSLKEALVTFKVKFQEASLLQRAFQIPWARRNQFQKKQQPWQAGKFNHLFSYTQHGKHWTGIRLLTDTYTEQAHHWHWNYLWEGKEASNFQAKPLAE